MCLTSQLLLELQLSNSFTLAVRAVLIVGLNMFVFKLFLYVILIFYFDLSVFTLIMARFVGTKAEGAQRVLQVFDVLMSGSAEELLQLVVLLLFIVVFIAIVLYLNLLLDFLERIRIRFFLLWPSQDIMHCSGRA